ALALEKRGVMKGTENGFEPEATFIRSSLAMLLYRLAGEPAVSVQVLGRQCGGMGDAGERYRRLLDALYQETMALIGQHISALDALAGALIEREALEGGDACAILDQALSNERQESA
ncbi:MAG: hypothetical protein IJ646_06710, partial [Clostridia bacterium]|nr:hypothetical protein [Clostridia bacterium]